MSSYKNTNSKLHGKRLLEQKKKKKTYKNNLYLCYLSWTLCHLKTYVIQFLVNKNKTLEYCECIAL